MTQPRALTDTEHSYAIRTPLPAEIVDAQQGWPAGTAQAARTAGPRTPYPAP
jgi:hypothetical protein